MLGRDLGMACSTSNTGETEATIFDSISELPDVIIQHIFSFLKPKEAARTSVLSKSWLRAWLTRPVLDFQSKFNRNFVEVVNNTLQNYCQKRIPIQKFRLHIEGLDTDNYIAFHEVGDHVRKWLRKMVWMVVQSDILELDLNTLNYSFVISNGDIKCCNLKKLKLKGVPMDDHTFHYFISSCPLIEQLHLEDCRGLTKIHAATIPNLRTFDLCCHTVEEINVNLPRLESFNCKRGVGVINIGKCTSLKSLSLSYSHITDMHLRSLLSKNPLLENLRLSGCHELEMLVISSLSFKRLSLDNCFRLQQLKIDAPNLHFLEYCNVWHQFPLLLTKPARKGKSSIELWCHGEIYADWFHSLRKFLTKFRNSTVTVAAYSNVWLNNERFGVIPLPSDHEVELLLDFNRIYLPLLERLLSMCHPTSVICTYDNNMSDNKDMIRNLCQELRSRIVAECCGSSQIKCWQHYIKNAKLFYVVDNERKPLDWINLIIPSTAPIELRQENRWRIAFALDWKPLYGRTI